MSLIPENSNVGVFLLYDAECFFCANYVQLLRLRQTIPELVLINAREPEAVQWFIRHSLHPDEGIALLIDGHYYFGAEAMQRIALLSTHSRWLNALNFYIFRHLWLARMLYPLLRAGRRIYLFLAGKSLILSSKDHLKQ